MSDSEARHRDEELDNQKYHHDEVDGEEEEEDLGFDDEEQDNEEEEYYNRKHKKGRKKRRLGANMFIDVEAAVDTEEEEEEEEEADLDFIQDDAEEVAAAEAAATVQHRQSFRQREMEEISAEELAQQIKDRYADYGYRREAPEYAGSSSWTPRVLLVPSVNDPHLWMIKCRPGKERDVVFMIMRKYFERKNTSKPMEICSAYCRDGLSGYVYLEARNQAQAQSALDKVSGLLGSKLQLVPVDQMQDVVTVKKKLPQLQNGAWVRVRRGKYAGDLARVISVSDTMDTVEVRLVPRLDLEKVDDYEKKRKKPFANSDPATRPPQRLFNPREAEKVDRSKPVLVRGHYFVWGADTFRDGYLEKEMKLTSLITQDVDPTLEEITRFAQGQLEADDANPAATLSNLASEAAAASAASAGENSTKASDLRANDHVEVVEGDMAGVTGVVTGVEGDNIIKVTLELGGLMKEKQASFSFPAHHLRKRFREGDHVQVLNGRYKDETGMVISVEESIVTILSDLNLDEIRVFAKDLRESTDTTSASTQAAGNIELYDMVNLGGVEVGIVTKIENGSLRVLDQNGETRHMRPDQVTPIRKNTRNNVAIDGQGNTVGVGDKVREIGGAQREGSVLQLNRFVAFVQSREHADNGGVFAVRTRNIANTAAKPASMAPNPYGGGPRDRGGMPMRGRGRGRGGFGGRGRDRAIGKSVIIVRGPYKGYLGIVKESDGAMARVELHTDARVVTIEKDKLCLRGPNGERIPLSDMGPGPAPGGFSAPPSERQDSWGYGPPSGSRTPSRAGSVYGDGSQTPSWQGSTAWGDNGGSGWGSGAKTPAWGGGVPETPGVPTPSAGSIPPETPGGW